MQPTRTQLITTSTLLAAAAALFLLAPQCRTPNRLRATVHDPPATRLAEKLEPRALRIEFSGPAAPLAAIGKPVEVGIALDPDLAGTWTWVNDRLLTFVPRQDWPIGQRYRVTLARQGFLAPHVELEEYKLQFSTAPFVARLAELQFYQDPTDPAQKKVVATLAFSHALDERSLADKLKLQLGATNPKGEFVVEKDWKLNVTVDELKGQAFVHSAPVPIPLEDRTMRLEVAGGLQAVAGGPAFKQALKGSVTIPGMYSYFRIADVTLAQPRDEYDVPQQALVIEGTAAMKGEDLERVLSVWLLPERELDERGRPVKHAAADEGEGEEEGQPGKPAPFAWDDAGVISPAILAKATRLSPRRLPSERSHMPLQSFSYQALAGRWLFVRIDKGLQSFGGYVLAKPHEVTLRVPEMPREVRIQGDGAILALSGQRALSVYSHQVKHLRLSLGRVLPEYLAHLVTQTHGVFSKRGFRGGLSEDYLCERFSETRQLADAPPGTPQYTAFDLGRYLAGAGQGRRGLFFVRVEQYVPGQDKGQPSPSYEYGGEGYYQEDGYYEPSQSRTYDTRLVLVTDLGLLVKDNLDRSHDVFVVSFASGQPVAGALVQVLGRNGLAVASATTDGQGRARVPNLDALEREKAPTAYLVTRGEDLAFMPWRANDRRLQLSRFDVGGEANRLDRGQLNAYLFSDRGLYRPGDTFTIGMLVRAEDWSRDLVDLPLVAVVSDPRGLTLKEQPLKLTSAGIEELRYTLRPAAPTGTYQIALYLLRPPAKGRGKPTRDLIGSTTVNVQEFLPDRMRISARLSGPLGDGWLDPAGLQAEVLLKNLYGPPAADRRVTGHLQLAPASPTFTQWPGYRFTDPLRTDQARSFAESLPEQRSDPEGRAVFGLGLDRFAPATYRLVFTAEGYEADGGRSVTTQARALVSPLEQLLGYKADGDLSYVQRGAERTVQLVAIDRALKGVARSGLKAALIEETYVSVLTKAPNGTFRYESKKRSVVRSESDLALPRAGLSYRLPTADPGAWVLALYDPKDPETHLLSVRFNVVGAANVARSLDRDAELNLLAPRSDYAPGEEIELQISAPYAGAGLITIERDRVYAASWFTAPASSTVQRIRVPGDLEGNAYVVVTMVRDLRSPEIYMSPLSYGVLPFSIDRGRRTLGLTLDAPDKVKPGERLTIGYQGDGPGSLVLFGVDEGILQVARYQTPDPLAHFFKKRALEVESWQILDQLMPELKLLRLPSATGGDEGEGQELIGKNLNPFRRKQQKAVAFWSGVLPLDQTRRSYSYEVPDSFNGALRLMAVAVGKATIGVARRDVSVQGDFVLSPNLPLTVAPGDRFTATIAVANHLPGSGPEARVKVALTSSPQLQIGGAEQELTICEGCEATASFPVAAIQSLGAATVTASASVGKHRARLATEISVRPLVPFYTTISAGSLAAGHEDVAQPRALFAEYRTLRAALAPVPLVLATGLTAYLEAFPYGCTEQLVSKVLPVVILSRRPELGVPAKEARGRLADALETLQGRVNEDGAFGLYAANANISDFASVYATHLLVEAKERGFSVPAGTLAKANEYLQHLARSPSGSSLHNLRLRAYAVYVLTRQGVTTTNLAAGLVETAKRDFADTWRADLTAAWLAASYRLLKVEDLALNLIARVRLDAAIERDYAVFLDPQIHATTLLFLLGRHFPERLADVGDRAIAEALAPLGRGQLNTLSAALAILALDAFSTSIGDAVLANAGVEELAGDGRATPLALPESKLLARLDFGPTARALRFHNRGELPLFYQVTVSGFDLEPPAPVSQGLEVTREYVDASGKAVSACALGDELQVRLRLRSPTQRWTPNLVAVDILPGGFDLEWQDNDPRGASGVERWRPDFVDRREDRVVLYGGLGERAVEFVYTIKATAPGVFAVPPAYAQSLYDPATRAFGAGGQTLTVSGR